ncbi:protein FAM81B isoform X1 [Talpa occidentalis]|uniref:protein FAM81B isoform X1 n=2 Tax=Talpa occidentalis TaxID=50954 RepID=UPI0023F8CB01|nr:protein FAM81B isoform X1 [Talpa occidentalis]
MNHAREGKRKKHELLPDTDVNKSAFPTAEEQQDKPDGPSPGSVSDQEKKVRLSPVKMSTKNSTDLVEYVDKGQSFLPIIPNTQRSQLEDRLNNQERTIAFLLEQAFRIKEDISACLQGAQGFRKEESLARKLLESHIQTITSIVKKLSQNIEILEDQIRVRDQVATGTNYAVQELNTKHSQGVGDLQGRVARCDSSIVKLSGDIHFIRHEHRRVEKTIQELLSALETVSKNLDMKVMQLLGKIEASSSEQASNVKMVQGDYRHEINLLEFKFNSLSSNLCEEVENLQKWTENRFIKYEKDHLDHINHCLKLLQEKLEKSENKMEEKLQKLSSKLENFINIQKQEAELNKAKNIENKLSKKMNQLEKLIWGELEKMQNEYQSGFKSVHDSLNSLQQIQKTKMDLEKHKVQKNIKKLQRKIVELQDI